MPCPEEVATTMFWPAGAWAALETLNRLAVVRGGLFALTLIDWGGGGRSFMITILSSSKASQRVAEGEGKQLKH